MSDDNAGRKTGKPATIRDVARKAGVAVGTVSRLLNGHEIRPVNRGRIEQAISELDFRRNSSAATIMKANRNFVGFILPAFDEFHTDVLATLIQTMRRAGYVVIPYSHGYEKVHLPDAIDYFREHRVAGIMTSGDADYHQHKDALRTLDCPLILYSNDLVDLAVDRVVVNDSRAAKRATQHLIQMGHHSIAILTGDLRDTTGQGRLHGFQAALSDAGLNPSHTLGNGWRQEDGYIAASEIMSTPPSAVFCSNYLLALGLFQYCTEHSIRIPEDISLITFGDSKHYPYYGGGLTAIRFPVIDIANTLTHLFLSRIRNPDLPASRKVQHDCELIVRGSVMALNAQD